MFLGVTALFVYSSITAGKTIIRMLISPKNFKVLDRNVNTNLKRGAACISVRFFKVSYSTGSLVRSCYP